MPCIKIQYGTVFATCAGIYNEHKMRNKSLHRVFTVKIIQAKHKNGLFIDRIEARQMIELAR